MALCELIAMDDWLLQARRQQLCDGTQIRQGLWNLLRELRATIDRLTRSERITHDTLSKALDALLPLV